MFPIHIIVSADIIVRIVFNFDITTVLMFVQQWGEEDPEARGPIVATTRHPMQRNAIGAHSGSYCIYKVSLRMTHQSDRKDPLSEDRRFPNNIKRRNPE